MHTRDNWQYFMFWELIFMYVSKGKCSITVILSFIFNYKKVIIISYVHYILLIPHSSLL